MKGEAMFGFGWSMLFGVLGALALLASGGFLVAHLTKQKGERLRLLQHYYYVLAIGLCSIGLILFGHSYYYFYRHFAGRVTTPGWLNPNEIYRVGGQAEIEGQNAVFLGNAKDDVWCVNSEAIHPAARFVRVIKSPDGEWKLEPLDISSGTKTEK